MFIMSVFVERLNDLMFDNNVDVATLEKAVGATKSSIYRYLSGQNLPSVKYIVSICDYFKCSVNYLVGLDNENYSTDFHACPPFSERFRFVLKKYNVSKYRLNKALGISDTTMYSWQRGEREPTIENLVKLAEYLDCAVDYLLGREK